MREYEIIVNFAKDKVISKSMVFVQDDNISTQLNFTFEDEIANDQNILLKFKNAKSIVFEDNIIVKDKKATYLVPNTLLGVTGYLSMSLTYASGDSVLTNSAFILNDIYIQAKLGEGEQPTQEELALIESVLGQLNEKITETNTTIANSETATANTNIAINYATVQGDYAKGQGNYAKNTGDTYADNLNNKVDKITGKGLSANDYTNEDKAKVNNLPSDINTILSNKADLENGKIVASQLPSFVDDVLSFDTLNDFPATGETGKIYIVEDTNITYRWSGTKYIEISSSLALGETSSTAFRGDYGKEAYEHSKVVGNPHNLTANDLGALTKVEHDNSLVGDGTIANPLKVNKEELASYDEYLSRKNAGTLLENKDYWWGE